ELLSPQDGPGWYPARIECVDRINIAVADAGDDDTEHGSSIGATSHEHAIDVERRRVHVGMNVAAATDLVELRRLPQLAELAAGNVGWRQDSFIGVPSRPPAVVAEGGRIDDHAARVSVSVR